MKSLQQYIIESQNEEQVDEGFKELAVATLLGLSSLTSFANTCSKLPEPIRQEASHGKYKKVECQSVYLNQILQDVKSAVKMNYDKAHNYLSSKYKSMRSDGDCENFMAVNAETKEMASIQLYEGSDDQVYVIVNINKDCTENMADVCDTLANSIKANDYESASGQRLYKVEKGILCGVDTKGDNLHLLFTTK